MMYLEASDHACPHLREQSVTAAQPTLASPSSQASSPFGAGRATAEPLRPASAGGNAGGWWAFAAEARTMTAAA